MTRHDDDPQAETVRFLTKPASHDPAPDRVERIDTHGAMVFLAGEVAIKVKRAVVFDYMDFSTLEKRRAVLMRELEINRDNAPQIYRDVVAITREADGSLAIAGSGEPVEWALRMNRFDQNCLLDRVAERDELDSELLDRLARMASDIHERAPPQRTGSGYDRIAAIVSQLDNAFATAKTTLPDDARQAFSAGAAATLETARRSLDLRAERGFVRRCHGDLHLGNIVLFDEKPVAFDALEFDDELATIDVLYDLAYLLMDLLHRGRRHDAHRLLNRYLRHSDAAANIYGLAALPVFLACRAGIRAMVSLDRAGQTGDPERGKLDAAAKDYLHAALGYLKPAAPRLIAVGGLSGTGKTTLAAALAPEIGRAPGALHLRSDVERKVLFGVPDTEPLPEEAYTKEAGDRVYDQLMQKARIALHAGHSAVVDAVFMASRERAAVADIAKRLDVPFAGLWLSAPQDTMVARVSERRGDASDATADIVRRQLAQATGPVSWPAIDASRPPDAMLVAARDILATTFARS